MRLLKSVKELKEYRNNLNQHIIVGFVPTMGALHEGHISLIKQAKQQSDRVICSIFVNPTQFNKKEDLDKYPRTIENDLILLKNAGTDAVFLPSVAEIYSNSYYLNFNFGALEQVMEGEFRAGHFNGVATVVSKLFNLVKPQKAFFGQKDLQQVVVIKDLVKALSFDIEIIACPIIRDENGLALSSRNARLSSVERYNARIINQSLHTSIHEAKKSRDIKKTIEAGKVLFKKMMNYDLEYLEIVELNGLQSVSKLESGELYAICIACPFGPVRLIDNEIFKLN